MPRTAEETALPGREFQRSALNLFWILCLVFASVPAARADEKAALIFYGGTVVTVNPAQPEAEALAVGSDGRIIAVGDLRSVESTATVVTRRVNISDRTLMPGFVEPHTHVIHTAYFQRIMKDLSSFTLKTFPGTIGEIQQVLRDELKKNDAYAKGKWLVAFGVDPSRARPFMASLDVLALDRVQEGVEIEKQVPIFVLNQSEHIGYVNSKAMLLAGINGHTPNPSGGVYVRVDEKCKPSAAVDCPLNGELHEQAAFQVFLNAMGNTSANHITQDRWLKELRATYACFAAAGVTTATELKLGSIVDVKQEFAMLSQLTGEQLRIRAYMDATASDASENRRPGGMDENWLSVIGVKFGADGSTQGLTAALTEPYEYQQPGGGTNRGVLNYAEDALFEAAAPYVKSDLRWQLAIHSNGDRALDQVLNVYERLIALRPQARDRRWRIEHLTVTNEDQLKRIRSLGLTASMTIGHVYYWGSAFGTDVTARPDQPAHKAILGPRAQRIDPANSLLAPRRIRFSFNSDSPVSPVAPLLYIATAVTREEQHDPLDKKTIPVLGNEQRITVDEAIRAVTLDAAYQLFLDDEIGSLEVGKFADLVLLEEDPRKVPAAEIRNIPVVATYVAGVQKYGPAFGRPPLPTCTPTVAPEQKQSPLPRRARSGRRAVGWKGN